MKKFLQGKFFRAIWSGALMALIYFICPDCFDKTTLLILLALEWLLINFSGIYGNRAWLIWSVRILTGGLFIFSGFIKANDPVGFSYKLEEYFEVFKNDTGIGLLDWMAHGALFFSIFICALEMALGFFLIFGYRVRLTLWLLILQIIFFTFLTFYSACFNKVTHCGCFGDFIKLKPWESFWKDVVLTFFITILFGGKEQIRPVTNPLTLHTLAVISLIVSIWFPIYTWRHLPVFDFRPYAIGENIKKNMEYPPNYQPAKYETRFLYKNLKTGEIKEFDMSNYPWQDTLNWAHDSTMNKLVQEEKNPPKIKDFNLMDLNGNNLTDSLLNFKGYMFWIVMYDLSKSTSDKEVYLKLNDIYRLSEKEKIPFFALTSSNAGEIDKFKHEYQIPWDFLISDGTVLKTMIRSNPGIMLIKAATVIHYWHYNDLPSFHEIKEKHMR
ncbi:MAG: DoxX family protein [Bacteroidia bacterium]|nr:DoxX family protein [Bacteroidia bacterium]